MKMGSENENIFRHIKNALIYSWDGLKAAWDNEMAFRTEAIVIALLMPIGIWIGQTAVQWALLIGSAMLVLITELLNSAVENVVDRIGTEHHILSKQAEGAEKIFLKKTLRTLRLCGESISNNPLAHNALLDPRIGNRFELHQFIIGILVIYILEKIRVQHPAFVKALQGVKSGTFYQAADIFNDFRGHNGLDAGGPKFTGNRRFHDNFNAGKDCRRVAVCLDVGGVPFRIGFQIHGNVISLLMTCGRLPLVSNFTGNPIFLMCRHKSKRSA